ncbi:MAG: FAD:protein FMN transferase [Bacteroidales bacterium]|nr:FAD:protein FMN transferase [Bacteroidales bacterium]
MMRVTLYLFFVLFISSSYAQTYAFYEGEIQGTTYHITCDNSQERDLSLEIDSILHVFDTHFSNYDTGSLISQCNKDELTVAVDSLFSELISESINISKKTAGAFDITVAPVVNAWGFGYKTGQFPTKATIDSMLTFIGYKNIAIENNTFIKNDKRISIISNAVAQGFSCDYVARYFNTLQINNYIIEIGGEIIAKGKNERGLVWTVGIDNPLNGNEIMTAAQLENMALATSGNYRRFYMKDGKKYAHTIDPKTGFPVEHNLLSATVITKTGLEADALATAFMVMGLDKAIEYTNKHSEIYAYLVYSNEAGALQSYITKGFKKFIVNENLK